MNHQERMQKLNEISAAVDRLSTQRDDARSEIQTVVSGLDNELQALHDKVVNAAAAEGGGESPVV